MFSAIIPAFQEEIRIKETLKETCRIFDSLSNIESFEIIVVDDGSSDDTFEMAESFARDSDFEVLCFKLPENCGKGNALRFGFWNCRGNLVTFLDADLDIHPLQLERLIRRMGDGVDVVVGSKRHPDSKINYPWNRRFLSSMYSLFLVRPLFSLDLRDTQAGLKLFRRGVLEAVIPRISVRKFAFDLELLVNANDLGYKIIEAPIDLEFGVSKMAFSNILDIFFDTLSIFYRRFSHQYNRRAELWGEMESVAWRD